MGGDAQFAAEVILMFGRAWPLAVIIQDRDRDRIEGAQLAVDTQDAEAPIKYL